MESDMALLRMGNKQARPATAARFLIKISGGNWRRSGMRHAADPARCGNARRRMLGDLLAGTRAGAARLYPLPNRLEYPFHVSPFGALGQWKLAQIAFFQCREQQRQFVAMVEQVTVVGELDRGHVGFVCGSLAVERHPAV